ncbi:MAG: tRNA lysidine(34) synthetase TilS [Chloroflexi bacterium]|nr:tRNA lysidine(34) synthetase TilS [Chloroflexota bacterium]
MSPAPPSFDDRASRDIAGRIRRACRASLDALVIDGRPRLLVGLSGGPDSSALLLALAAGAMREGWAIVAAHIDHGIAPPPVRREFEGAARAVADRVGVPLRVGRVDAPAEAARRGDGLEAAARRLRYDALLEIAAAAFDGRPAHAIVVGHTMDDQAESVLLHLIRGSGSDGLAGMPAGGVVPRPGARTPLLRPLLDIRRSETAALCAAAGAAPVHDPANDDPSYTRVRLRRDVLPALRSINPAIVERLAALAGAVAVDRALLDQLTAAAADALQADSALPPAPAGAVVFSRRGLARQPRAIRARLLRRQVVALGGEAPDWGRTGALLRLAERGGHQVQCAGGVVAAAAGDRLCIRRDAGPPPAAGPCAGAD